jgi:hypothetical protein
MREDFLLPLAEFGSAGYPAIGAILLCERGEREERESDAS